MLDINQFGGTIEGLQSLALEWVPRLLSALLIIIVAHFLAKAAKWALAAVFNRLPFAKTANVGAEKHETLGARLGEVGYWLIWLVGLIAALNVLNLSYVVAPLNRLIAGFFAYLPNAVGAAIIFFVGWVIAMVARRVVGSTVAAMPIENLTAKVGLPGITPQNLARAVAQLTFLVIIVPVAIAGLQALRIEAISTPAIQVLDQILLIVPKLIGASMILGVSFLISRWLSGLVGQTLPALGLDASVRQLGLFADAEEGTYPVTKAAAWLVTTAVMLFGGIEASKVLGFDAASDIFSDLFHLGGRILLGGIIIVAGSALANILANALNRTGGESAQLGATIARWATIGLSVAMGLRQMGLADDIITLAFGLILGSAAVAVAIAFGYGGRESAANLLAKWIKK